MITKTKTKLIPNKGLQETTLTYPDKATDWIDVETYVPGEGPYDGWEDEWVLVGRLYKGILEIAEAKLVDYRWEIRHAEHVGFGNFDITHWMILPRIRYNSRTQEDLL